MVYNIIKDTVTYINTTLQIHVKKINYFSDGYTAQYKKGKNFLNLCYHQKDFSIDCQWDFFATSHRKSPCDVIGGTVKRLVSNASLQSEYDDCSSNLQLL